VKRLYHVDGTIRREVSAMTIDVDAVYEDGVLKPEHPLALKEKARLHLTIEANAEEALPVKDDDDPTGWKAVEALRGIVKRRRRPTLLQQLGVMCLEP
jgi:predicted DNA-binding antitoxin AbrB/MazE fold protein